MADAQPTFTFTCASCNCTTHVEEYVHRDYPHLCYSCGNEHETCDWCQEVVHMHDMQEVEAPKYARVCEDCYEGTEFEYVTVRVPVDNRPLIQQITNPTCALCGAHSHQIGANND